MPSPRHFTLRHLWIALAILMCPVLAALVVSWAVFYHRDWMLETFGRRAYPILERFVNIRLTLPAVDSDGDGDPDWFETWIESDPHDPASLEAPHLECPYLISPLGYVGVERKHLEFGVSLRGLEWRWRYGRRVQVSADSAVLLLPGSSGIPSAGPLELKPNARGGFELDLLASRPGPVKLRFSDPSPGRRVDVTQFFAGDLVFGWRCSPLPTATIWTVPQEKIRHFPPGLFEDKSPIYDTRVGEVIWPHLPVTHYHLLYVPPLPPVWQALGQYRYVLEIAQADHPDDWVTFDDAEKPPYMDGPGQRQIHIMDILRARERFPGYRGPFLFRVVPIIVPASPRVE